MKSPSVQSPNTEALIDQNREVCCTNQNVAKLMNFQKIIKSHSVQSPNTEALIDQNRNVSYTAQNVAI